MTEYYDRAGQPIDAATRRRLATDERYLEVATNWVSSASSDGPQLRVSTMWLSGYVLGHDKARSRSLALPGASPAPDRAPDTDDRSRGTGGCL